MKSKIFLSGVLLFLCACSFLPYLIKPPFEEHRLNKGLAWEEYDSSYFSKFQTVQAIIKAADQHFDYHQKNSQEYYSYIAEILRKRFYHGYSHYSLSDNPLAFMAGRLWSHLSAIVIPDDILKHPMAACSQQAIVFMEIFKRQGVDFRKIGFTGHFTLEGKIEGSWVYFDTNIEPDFKNKRESLDELLRTKGFDSAYTATPLDTAIFHKQVSNPKYGKVNASPAPNATLFHQACYLVISRPFLVLLLVVTVFYSVGINRLQKIIYRLLKKQDILLPSDSQSKQAALPEGKLSNS